MKISITITILILLTGVFLNRQLEGKMRLEQERWQHLSKEREGSLIGTRRSAEKGSLKTIREKKNAEINRFVTELADFLDQGKGAGALNEEERIDEMLRIFDTFLVMDSEELEMVVNTLSRQVGTIGCEKLEWIDFAIRALSAQDPKRALAAAMHGKEQYSDGEYLQRMLQEPLINLAGKDPAAVVSWFKNEGNQGITGQGRLKMQVIAAVAESDMPAALKLMASLGFADHKECHWSLAVGCKTPEQATQYFRALKKFEMGKEGEVSIAEAFTASVFMRKSELAQSWLDSQEIGAEHRDLIISALAEDGLQMMRGFGEREQSWLDYLVKFDERTETEAAGRLIAAWAQRDFRAAGEWINQQEAGPGKDGLIFTYAEALAEYEPAAAAEWASVLPVSEERKSLLEAIAQSWKEIDAEAAAAFIEKWKLTE